MQNNNLLIFNCGKGRQLLGSKAFKLVQLSTPANLLKITTVWFRPQHNNRTFSL